MRMIKILLWSNDVTVIAWGKFFNTSLDRLAAVQSSKQTVGRIRENFELRKL